MDILPCSALFNQVLAFGFDCTDSFGPNVETLNEFNCEILQFESAGINVLSLLDSNGQAVSNVSALDENALARAATAADRKAGTARRGQKFTGGGRNG